MTVQENRAFIKRYLEAISGKEKTPELLNRYVADVALKQHMQEADRGFPRYELIADDIIAEGDKVMLQARIKGVHQGVFNGIPPTGKQLEIEGAVIYQIKDEKIVNHWLLTDNLTLLQQLGVVPQQA